MPKLNKLLANLPFNPSLIEQVSFYAKRLKKEKAIRRLGFVLLLLAMCVQLFAAMSPPRSSLAQSNNDLILGGFTTHDQAVLHCLDGNEDYYKILLYYGINCTNVHDATETWLGPHDYNDQLYSMGRNPYSLPGEQPVNIPGTNNGNPLYLRFLWGWGNAPPYHVLQGHTDSGLLFFLMYDCGNLVFVNVPSPATPPPSQPPSLTLNKSVVPGYPAANSTVKPGTQLGYRLNYGNASGSTAVAVILEDGFPANTSYVSANQGAATTLNSPKTEPGNAHWGSNQFAQWIFNQLAVGQSGSVDLFVKVNDDTPDGTVICNQAFTAALNNINFVGSNIICHTVKRSTPPPPKIGNAECSGLTASLIATRTYRFVATTAGENYTVKSYDFDFGDSTSKTITTDLRAGTTDHQYTKAGTYTTKVDIVVSVRTATGKVNKTIHCQTNVTVTDTPPTKPCEDFQSSDNLEVCLTPHKTAKNTTQGIANANNTTVKAGDVIEYTLSVTNIGKVKVPGFIFRESLSDVLDYADVVDLHGGKMDSHQIVTWPAIDVKSKQTVQKLITVKIKNPIPSTPVSSSDPGHFNCVMTNVYGDTINLKLSPNAVCVAEAVNRTLPNTGPGTSVIAVVSLTIIVGYFFARSRLLSEEVDLVRSDYAATGGL